MAIKGQSSRKDVKIEKRNIDKTPCITCGSKRHLGCCPICGCREKKYGGSLDW